MRNADVIVLLVVAVVVAASVGLIYLTMTAPESRDAPPGDALDITREPIQLPAEGVGLPVLKLGGRNVFMTPLASYDIAGVLVSKKAYGLRPMDRLSPWDYAIGWGYVDQMLPWLKFSHSSRYISFRYKPGSLIDGQYVQSHISNNHLIPASENIRRALRLGKKGMPVRLEGHLVNLQVQKGSRIVYTWGSSTTRDDRGNGACELIYVTRLRLGDQIYE